MERLIDERLGVLTAVRRQEPAPDMPAAWVAYGANVARTSEWGSVEADRFGFGAALGDPERARRAAIGEAIERYCGNVVPASRRRAAWCDLPDALDPAELALFSRVQYDSPGFPFVPFTRDLEVDWVEGRRMPDGAPVRVPASLVYLDTRNVSTPPTNPLMYAGIATGGSRADAERAALEELFERDASTIWWATGATALYVEDAADLIDALDDPCADERTVRLFAIPSEFGVPVVAAFVEDAVLARDGRGSIAFGTACRSSPREAATKALVEAFGLLQVTAQLADPSSALWRSVAQGTLRSHTYKAFRSDRRYLDSFRPDFRDLVDLPAVAQLYLDPRMRATPLDRLRRETPAVRLSEMPAVSPTSYVERLGEAGLTAYSVDVTTPDVASVGLHVVRVVVPGLYGNAPAAFPFLGGRRCPDARARFPIPLA